MDGSKVRYVPRVESAVDLDHSGHISVEGGHSSETPKICRGRTQEWWVIVSGGDRIQGHHHLGAGMRAHNEQVWPQKYCRIVELYEGLSCDLDFISRCSHRHEHGSYNC